MTPKILLILSIASIVLFGWFYLTPFQIAHSQGEAQVQCGQELDVEFTSNVQEHIYELPIEPRWSFDVSVKPYGDDLWTIIALYGPTDNLIDLTDGPGGATAAYYTVSKSPAISSGILSSRGPYKIRVANTAIWNDTLKDEARYYGGVGFYTLSIGCTTSDGQKIEPGSLLQPTPTPSLTTEQDSAPVPTALQFLESGKSYDVYLNSDVHSITVVEIREDGWIRVAIDNRIGWLNLSQVALIMPHDE
ncbi:MAG: hypothetical protein R3A44_30845 [Caldilineaceae bacterium]